MLGQHGARCEGPLLRAPIPLDSVLNLPVLLLLPTICISVSPYRFGQNRAGNEYLNMRINRAAHSRFAHQGPANLEARHSCTLCNVCRTSIKAGHTIVSAITADEDAIFTSLISFDTKLLHMSGSGNVSKHLTSTSMSWSLAMLDCDYTGNRRNCRTTCSAL